MFPRTAAATVLRLVLGFPIVAITGPRQAGKTTRYERQGVQVMGWRDLAAP